ADDQAGLTLVPGRDRGRADRPPGLPGGPYRADSSLDGAGMKAGRPAVGPRNPVITCEVHMPDTSPTIDERLVLPLVPLSSGVVLPQMVVTLALETEEAQT